MTASYFRSLAGRCRTAGRDSFDLFAKEEFRQLATEFKTKADELIKLGASCAGHRQSSSGARQVNPDTIRQTS